MIIDKLIFTSIIVAVMGFVLVNTVGSPRGCKPNLMDYIGAIMVLVGGVSFPILVLIGIWIK